MRISGWILVFAVASTSCMPLGQSRVAQGQLYVPGRAEYDAYFRDVHSVQVDASAWADDRKTSHKSLVTALDLTPDAPDVTIIQATHERASKYSARPGTLRLEVTGTDAKVTGTNGENPAFFKAV